jgi:hypothetical protein
MRKFAKRLEVEFDEIRDAFVIRDPSDDPELLPSVVVRRETLLKMSLKEAAEFIGVRLISMTPATRELFKDYFWTDEGKTPPKLS